VVRVIDLIPDKGCRCTAHDRDALIKSFETISQYIAEHGPIAELWVEWPPYGVVAESSSAKTQVDGGTA